MFKLGQTPKITLKLLKYLGGFQIHNERLKDKPHILL